MVAAGEALFIRGDASADRAVHGEADRARSDVDDELTEREREVRARRLAGTVEPPDSRAAHLPYATVKTHLSTCWPSSTSGTEPSWWIYAYESGLAVPGRS